MNDGIKTASEPRFSVREVGFLVYSAPVLLRAALFCRR
jgi:hypothetical protein